MRVNFRIFVQWKDRKGERKTRFKTFNTEALLFIRKIKKHFFLNYKSRNPRSVENYQSLLFANRCTLYQS